MKCSISGCPGEYEAKTIVHIVKRDKDVLVFENVPAEVCGICSDTLLPPETVQHLEEMMRHRPKPDRFAPRYEYV